MALNAALFQLGWWCAILGAARHRAQLGTAVVAVVLLLHIVTSRRPLQAAALLMLSLALGVAVEAALRAFGITAFSAGDWELAGAPLWIVSLWGLFATTLTISLRWLQRRWLLAALFGAVGGALSYGAGAKLGALELPAPISLGVIAVVWAAALPLMSELARRSEATP